MTASPAGNPSGYCVRRISLHAANMSGPPARWIAPSTPPPPISVPLAALTMASTDSLVMSPVWTITRSPRNVLSAVMGVPFTARNHPPTSKIDDLNGVPQACALAKVSVHAYFYVQRLPMIVNWVSYQNGRRLANIPASEIHSYIIQPDCFVWVALKDPEPAELAAMQAEFGLHDLAVEDA